MKQTIPHSFNDLLATSATAIKGASRHAQAIQLAYNNATAIGQARSEALASRDAFDAATLELLALQAELKQFTADARAFAMLARDLLKVTLGRSFNPAWLGTGFVGSLEVPERPAELEILMEALHQFFARNAAREVPGLGVTAPRAAELHAGLKTARHAVQTKRTERRALGRVRRQKFAALRNRLTALARELLQVIPKTDPRWRDYGLNIPGAPERPEHPANVSAMIVGASAVTMKWDRAPRAERYHVHAQVEGVNETFMRIGTVEDPDFLWETAPRDATVRLLVTALNDGGESGPSSLIVLRLSDEPPIGSGEF